MMHAVTIDETSVTIDITCKECNTNHAIVLDKERYIKWQTGTRIQFVFPEIDLDTRELLISGICGSCFDNLFSESPSFLPDNDFFMET